MRIKITKAEWDLRAKTKFLRVDGIARVDAFDDEVIAEIRVADQSNDSRRLFTSEE